MSDFSGFVAICEVTVRATCDCCRGDSVSQTVWLITREDAERLRGAGLAAPDKEGYQIYFKGVDIEEWFMDDSSESIPDAFADISVREISTGRGLPERMLRLGDLEAAAEAAFD